VTSIDQSWIWFTTGGWGFPFTLYVCAQLLSLLFLRGRARRLALIPIPLMGLVLAVTCLGYLARSNLWPIWLMLISPVAALYLVVLWVGTAVAIIRKGQ
jgi:hypothetical protein